KMGHARLIVTDHTSSWPAFLKTAAATGKTTKPDNSSGVVVIRMKDKDAEAKLEKLTKNQTILEIVDVYDELLAELLISRDAHLYKANEDVQQHSISSLIDKHYGNKKSWQMGSWVYFGWSRKLVHILEEDLF